MIRIKVSAVFHVFLSFGKAGITFRAILQKDELLKKLADYQHDLPVKSTLREMLLALQAYSIPDAFEILME